MFVLSLLENMTSLFSHIHSFSTSDVSLALTSSDTQGALLSKSLNEKKQLKVQISNNLKEFRKQVWFFVYKILLHIRIRAKIVTICLTNYSFCDVQETDIDF